ncbi:tRNA (adenosine(37)-N6)-dimethylallyltransferase MiaA [Candidatus Gromoviella agglomerans]|uniref:tRNA (adenosine(37)-N6)-dimethylallyltransferase MiaA n=1 Tax=Candidatus Gromoviella agglomerans TaxID=2806609 RepID=UPI001E62D371|nr:tRNA (adenosine(37)-N6)-dimethylallyltransferase MiaA [Candidatus Gromoviella agglomerans]UFX98525.1 tRNA dimethylallyltransferase [Candidatus Gromoviella agglomerans]
MREVIVIGGPTASGKSKLAIEYALRFGGEIINADRMQMYEDLRILSASPLDEDLNYVPHHLYNFASPFDDMNVRQWLDLVHYKIREIISRGRLPIVVGGTGMYIYSLVNGLVDIPDIGVDESLFGLEITELKKILKDIDIIAAQSIDCNNRHRVIRAIQVMRSSGRSIMSYTNNIPYPYYKFFCIFVTRPFERLKKNISSRLAEMSELKREMQDFLKKMGDKENCAPIWRMIGANTVRNFANEEISFQEMMTAVTFDTVRYAKRQITWFRNKFVADYIICC